MSYKLAYLRIENGKQLLKVEKDILLEDYIVIKEANQVIGKFNVFCDYYYMLEQSLNDVLQYILKVSDRNYKLDSPIKKHFTIMELNRLFTNFTNMFNNYLSYYEVDIKDVFGENSKEFKEIKKIENNFFDDNFEYRLIYNLRNYSDHYKIPITSLKDNANNSKRHFYITKDSLLNWKKINKHLKPDIESLANDIDVLELLNKMKKIIYELHKKFAMINNHDVLASYTYLKKYFKINETPYIIEIKNEKEFKKGKFKIETLFDEVGIVGYNILNMGFISYGSYKKDEGFFFFDPFNMMFTKEQKEKLKLE